MNVFMRLWKDDGLVVWLLKILMFQHCGDILARVGSLFVPDSSSPTYLAPWQKLHGSLRPDVHSAHDSNHGSLPNSSSNYTAIEVTAADILSLLEPPAFLGSRRGFVDPSLLACGGGFFRR
ncbi:hypothetical protein BDW02DRAFT_325793 [Decorospora gaudefroyi]|uniref:Uncharacterized protein n=1 Tax=Decorospora gaudefroyi TaxID=184978 RepID=A0A6A5KEG5_9PLEO|nr:hypothetical protein BDW02DRAFT_325793 [Decorospora gaudefroyi]